MGIGLDQSTVDNFFSCISTDPNDFFPFASFADDFDSFLDTYSEKFLYDPDQDGLCGDLDPQPDVFNFPDSDGIDDWIDNCPATYNPNQADADADGLGDACEDDAVESPCGDANDDTSVDALDVSTLRDYLTDPNGSPLPGAGQSKCSVIGGYLDCDIADVTALRRALEVPGFPPGIAAICEAAVEG